MEQKNNEDANYCSECGHKVNVLTKCNNCGKTVDGNHKFCTNCGTSLIIKCEHDWLNATYLEPKKCTKCGATEDEKLECTTRIDENEDSLCDNCNATIEKPVIKEYKPKWEPNQQTGGWNGNGMEVKIFVLPVSMYDPFDLNYSNPDKKNITKANSKY